MENRGWGSGSRAPASYTLAPTVDSSGAWGLSRDTSLPYHFLGIAQASVGPQDRSGPGFQWTPRDLPQTGLGQDHFGVKDKDAKRLR